jgi:GDP-L-fucose synthase
MIKKNSKIFVAGHRGMVGSSLIRLLSQNRDIDLVFESKRELDLTNQAATNDFFAKHKFDHVYLAAARVGGINANNTYPANFIYENIMIQTNVIHACYQSQVKKLLFLGSSCIYPKNSEQPIKEGHLLSGKLEPTNEPYAIAKIAGIKMCESYNRQFNTDFRSIMPTNLYGEGDNFHLENSHVVPALIRKFHQGMQDGLPSVEVWGSGNAKREFLYVDDLASAAIHTLNLEKSDYATITKNQLSHINVGSGEEISISELALIISEVTNFKGKIIFNKLKPEGPSRKIIDSELIRSTGWEPSVSTINGLNKTYDFYKNSLK